MERASAASRIKAAKWAQRTVVGRKGESWDNHAVAHFTFQDDLDWQNPNRHDYGLDETTRDILIAHARQDSAHALLNTISLIRLARQIRLLAWLLLALLIYIVFRLS